MSLKEKLDAFRANFEAGGASARARRSAARRRLIHIGQEPAAGDISDLLNETIEHIIELHSH